MIAITFYDIGCWDIAERLDDISSIIGFIMILSIFVIIGFSKFTTFQVIKPLCYYIMFLLNIIIVLCFTIHYAVLFSLALSISLYLIYDKYDVPNMYNLALKGATGLNIAKVKKQTEDFEKLTEEDKKKISDNIPNIKRVKIKFLPWFIITFLIPASISIVIKLVVNY